MGLDLAAIRGDLATIMQGLGFTSSSFVNTDPGDFPAAWAGIPSSVVPLTVRKMTVTLPLTMAFSLADVEDAQRRLDTALSLGNDGSVYDALHDPQRTAGASWESIRWVRADNVRELTLGETKTLALDITLEFTG